jgi:hypothetical protein
LQLAFFEAPMYSVVRSGGCLSAHAGVAIQRRRIELHPSRYESENMSRDIETRLSRFVYLRVVIASMVIFLYSVTNGATVTTESNVLLNQSPSDALQGVNGVLSAGASIPVGSVSGLTDASTSTTPTDLQYFNPDSSVTITYDFGAAGAATRELSSVSIWLHAGDVHRVDYAGGVAVSSDNLSFTPVASTNRVEFTSGAPTQSHVLYSFVPMEVVGFRYLQIRDEAVFQDQGTTFGTGPYHPWIIEIDAFLGSPGDYNNNGIVDAADYVVWRKSDGTLAGYNLWRSHFGQPPGSGSGSGGASLFQVAVPEPATFVLLMFASACWCLRRGQSA